MKAFDTDILTHIFQGHSGYMLKAAQIPAAERSIPLVVAEQILRGRMHSIRLAEAGKTKAGIDVAFAYLERTIADLGRAKILSFTPHTEAIVQAWKKQKIKVSSSDMRIAAICIVHAATLVSRNRRDFDQVPGLIVEYW